LSFAVASAGLVEVEADQGRHRAGTHRHRRLHGAAADTQQAGGIGNRQAAGGGERRILAERMTGDKGDLILDPHAARFKHAQRGKADGHECRLRVLGQRQRFDRTFEDHRRELLRQRLVDFGEDGAGLGKCIGEPLAHADRLTALPRKHECRRHPAAFRPRGPFLGGRFPLCGL
jgi:hypothetical protein